MLQPEPPQVAPEEIGEHCVLLQRPEAGPSSVSAVWMSSRPGSQVVEDGQFVEHPSSVMPSQSSSTPSPQTSGAPVTAGASQVVAWPPAEHTYVPVRRHAPRPTVQGLPVSNPLSTSSSQSLSIPSHSSG